MAFVIADRVRETTTTIGTGSVTLGGAYTSFQTFSAAIGNGNNTYYTIASASSGEWEVGIGTYASGGNLLSRDTVLASSNAGNLVNFSVGSKDVFVTQPSERSLLINAASNGLFAGNAAFTANGVLYANSTTTLTTGSVLTFDGTSLGIGVAPSAKLDVSGASGGIVYVRGTGDAYQEIAGGSRTPGTGSLLVGQGNAGEGYLWNRFNSYLAFGVNNSEQMRLTSTGLGIGTSSPDQKLQIAGGASNAWAHFTNNTNTSGLYVGTSSAGEAILYQAGNYYMGFYTNSTERMRLDASGNLGLGVTPSAWGTLRGLQVGNASIAGFQNFAYLNSNAFYDGSAWKYISNGFAAKYDQVNSVHAWYTAPSGNAGDPITFTQAMTLDASGNLGVGTTSPTAAKLHVAGYNGGAVYPIRMTSTNAGVEWAFETGGTNAATSFLAFRDIGNSATRMTLDASGNLGIGTSSPGFKLSVSRGGTAGVIANLTDGLAQTLQITTGSGYVGFLNPNYGAITFRDGGNVTEFMRLDSSGNLGLGVTPSAWSAGRTTLQINGTTQPNIQFTGNPTNGGAIWTNSFFDGTSPKYVATGAASIFATSNGGFQWQIAPSGNAGDPITFTQAMTLDASGRLLIGPTSASSVGNAILGVTGGVAYDGNFSLIAQLTNDTTAAGKGVLLGFNNSTNSGIISSAYGNGTESLAFWTHNNTAWGERARIDSSGNLLVGTTSASTRFTLNVSGANDGITLRTTNEGAIGQLGMVNPGSNNDIQIGTLGVNNLRFFTNGTANERARITSAGDLLVGTTNVVDKVTVFGGVALSWDNDRKFWMSFDNTYRNGVRLDAATRTTTIFATGGSGDGGSIAFNTRAATGSGPTDYGTERMRLDSSGNLGLGVTPSAWGGSGVKAFDVGAGASFAGSGSDAGMIANAYFNGSNWIYKTSSLAVRYQQLIGTGAHAWFTAPSGTANDPITFTQAMTLDASGRLGIGTTSPFVQLHVSNSGATATFSRFGNSAGDTYLGTNADGSSELSAAAVGGFLKFMTGGGTERARIDSSGNFGIGVTSPGAKLDVYSSSTTAGTPIAFFGKALNSNATSNVLVQFLINFGGTGSGQINANGASAAAFGTYSDARLKENIVSLPPQLANICALRPVEFDYKDGSGHQIGFVAQEMQTVYPDVVGSGNDEMLTVTGWSKTEARLVKAIQELKAEFDAYKATHP